MYLLKSTYKGEIKVIYQEVSSCCLGNDKAMIFLYCFVLHFQYFYKNTFLEKYNKYEDMEIILKDRAMNKTIK